ncbi:hypothetical protein WBK31_19970 [Nonomuraea sp. N2-4H]|uniref:hypothetical protein n=1 Tax=Nonomuraea sp. N2-4H TaxID=3128898 RepID=UPI003250F685
MSERLVVHDEVVNGPPGRAVQEVDAQRVLLPAPGRSGTVETRACAYGRPAAFVAVGAAPSGGAGGSCGSNTTTMAATVTPAAATAASPIAGPAGSAPR